MLQRFSRSILPSSRIARGGHGLTEHMRSSRRRAHGLPTWLFFTVLSGACVALVFMNFFAH